MTQVDPTDARLPGIILLFLVPLLVADGVSSARGRYSGIFWVEGRDRKIEGIAKTRGCPPLVGAKLGAIGCGFTRTHVGADGINSLKRRGAWTSVDTLGRRSEIYGSEGWGSSSPERAIKIPR
jgi:hypothetical protein